MIVSFLLDWSAVRKWGVRYLHINPSLGFDYMEEPGTYVTPIEKDNKHLDYLDGIKVVSLNCNGLGDHEKRSRCRVALRSFDVRLLQETHATLNTQFGYEKLLGGSRYQNSFAELVLLQLCLSGRREGSV